MRALIAVAPVVALLAIPAWAVDNQPLVDRPTLWLQLGRPVAVESYWKPGNIAGALSFDLPVSRLLSLVVTAGASGGTHYHGFHGDTTELAEQHVAAGFRVTSRSRGPTRTFCWAGLAYFRAEHRVEYWLDGARYVARDSTGTPGAIVGVGFLASIRGTRLCLVGELTGLLPFTQVSAGENSYPPKQLLGVVGVRLVL
jgi:hypothetical protein